MEGNINIKIKIKKKKNQFSDDWFMIYGKLFFPRERDSMSEYTFEMNYFVIKHRVIM